MISDRPRFTRHRIELRRPESSLSHVARHASRGEAQPDATRRCRWARGHEATARCPNTTLGENRRLPPVTPLCEYASGPVAPGRCGMGTAEEYRRLAWDCLRLGE